MRRSIPILLLSCLFAANVWGAGKSEPKFRGVEVRHFNGNEGVELTAEFYDFLYAAMKAELQKTKLFAQIIGEGRSYRLRRRAPKPGQPRQNSTNERQDNSS
jgi:hypothetical protein